MKFQKLKDKPDIVLYEVGMFEKSMDKLEPGVYEMDFMGMGIPTFRPIEEKESLIEFDNGIVKDIMREIQFFFEPRTKKAYEELKLTYKTGFILHGKHGTGKTCTAMLAMRKIAKQFNAICFDTDKLTLSSTIGIVQNLRKIQDNPIILFFDECDSTINAELDVFTKFTDGNTSLPGVVFLGCTNHLDKIPPKVRNRKSRIKKCFEIKSLPQQVYKQYLTQKLPNITKETVNEFCYKASEKSMTIDQFKNAIIEFRIFDLSIDKAISSAMEVYGKDEDDDSNKGGGGFFTFSMPTFFGGGRKK